MTTSSQVLSLLKNHFSGNNPQFMSVAIQIAAEEARKGHGKTAEEIRLLVEKAKGKSGVSALSPLKGPVSELLSVKHPEVRLSDLILTGRQYDKLARVLIEQEKADVLREHDLSPRRKLLLIGPPGTGKTMTAACIAGALQLPLFTVLYERLFTSFMGETTAKLKLVFEQMQSCRGVYFFDEFDAIGSHRSAGNDVGEVRRILNSFLQFLENDQSDSLIIAATNHSDLLDRALWRRFDDAIEYDLPTPRNVERLIRTYLLALSLECLDFEGVVEAATGLSQSEIVRACTDAAKDAVLQNKATISGSALTALLLARKLYFSRSQQES